MNDKVRATIEFPREVWRDFMVYVKRKETTASKLIRDFVRKTLEKAEQGEQKND